jgi:hypothetical protein
MIKMKSDLLLGFWRQAYDSPVTLSFPTYKKANAFRLRLYVAVRPFRDDANGDIELHLKINQLEAIASELPDGRGQLVIRPAEMNEELARLAREAGLPWGFNVVEAEESQRRMLERLAAIETPDLEPVRQPFDYNPHPSRVLPIVEEKGGIEESVLPSFQEGLSLYDEE